MMQVSGKSVSSWVGMACTTISPKDPSQLPSPKLVPAGMMIGTCVMASVHCAPNLPPSGVVRFLAGGEAGFGCTCFREVPHAKPSALCMLHECQSMPQSHSHLAALICLAHILQWIGRHVCLACSCLLAQLCMYSHPMLPQRSRKTSGLGFFRRRACPLKDADSR